MESIAAIDIGSNTLRLLIAEKSGEELRPILRDREIVRLGRNFFPDLLLSPQAVEAAIEVLKRFQAKINREGAEQVIAVGTGVLREAENIDDFLEQVHTKTGIPVKIIRGHQEAQLMAKGVLSVFPSTTGKSIIFDIGGGSTEFVFLNRGKLQDQASLPLGVVGLTERFLKSDPPEKEEIEGLKIFCRKILRKNLPGTDTDNILIGTAGSVTTLAAMLNRITDYQPEWINGKILHQGPLLELSARILSRSCIERKKMPGLEPGRADIIPAGILLVLEIMDHFSQKILLVSDAGLLEGLILERSRV